MRVAVRSTARKLPFYANLRSIYHRIRKTPRHPLQDLIPASGYRFKRMGSEYGAWTFVDDESLTGSTIVSAGLGEDASFDIEFANAYNARIIIVDPTPRAKVHFEEILATLGRAKRNGYAVGGKQPIGAYDLRRITPKNLTLVPKALWNRSTVLKFFEPINTNHVSHSIVNYQRGFSDEGSYIEVESTTIVELLTEFELSGSSEPPLIKLDIEGAEVEVICDMLDNGLRPKQILVEFDELNAPSLKGYSRVDFVNDRMNQSGYKCVWTDGQANFLYIHTYSLPHQSG